MFSLLLVVVLLYSQEITAKAKIAVEHGKTADGFAQIKVVNKTNTSLTCHIAINGHKVRFNLTPLASSKWYKATHKQFNYRQFSTWCDALALHPEKE